MSKRGTTKLKVYDYIYDRITNGNTPPTVREICAALGLRSTSTAYGHLERLRDDGFINFDPNLQRTIRLTDSIPEGSVAHELHCGVCDENSMDSASIPLVGTVAAGQPILAFEDYTTRYVLPKQLLHGSAECDTLLLTVDGDSMVDIGMLSGDMIIVSKTAGIADGDIVVARVYGDSATVKRLFRECDRVRLQPENRCLQPIFVANEDVEIIGRVIGLIRSY